MEPVNGALTSCRAGLASVTPVSAGAGRAFHDRRVDTNGLQQRPWRMTIVCSKSTVPACRGRSDRGRTWGRYVQRVTCWRLVRRPHAQSRERAGLRCDPSATVIGGRAQCMRPRTDLRNCCGGWDAQRQSFGCSPGRPANSASCPRRRVRRTCNRFGTRKRQQGRRRCCWS